MHKVRFYFTGSKLGIRISIFITGNCLNDSSPTSAIFWPIELFEIISDNVYFACLSRLRYLQFWKHLCRCILRPWHGGHTLKSREHRVPFQLHGVRLYGVHNQSNPVLSHYYFSLKCLYLHLALSLSGESTFRMPLQSCDNVTFQLPDSPTLQIYRQRG